MRVDSYLADNQNRHPLDDPRLVRAFLDQGEVWCAGYRANYLNSPLGPGEMRYVPIAQMTPGHALNTARFVLGRARDICLALLVAGEIPTHTPLSAPASPQADAKGVIPGMPVNIHDDREARAFLWTKALVIALVDRATARPETSLPWESLDVDRALGRRMAEEWKRKTGGRSSAIVGGYASDAETLEGAFRYETDDDLHHDEF